MFFALKRRKIQKNENYRQFFSLAAFKSKNVSFSEEMACNWYVWNLSTYTSIDLILEILTFWMSCMLCLRKEQKSFSLCFLIFLTVLWVWYNLHVNLVNFISCFKYKGKICSMPKKIFILWSFTYYVTQKMRFQTPFPPCYKILIEKNLFCLNCYKISELPSHFLDYCIWG